MVFISLTCRAQLRNARFCCLWKYQYFTLKNSFYFLILKWIFIIITIFSGAFLLCGRWLFYERRPPIRNWPRKKEKMTVKTLKHLTVKTLNHYKGRYVCWPRPRINQKLPGTWDEKCNPLLYKVHSARAVMRVTDVFIEPDTPGRDVWPSALWRWALERSAENKMPFCPRGPLNLSQRLKKYELRLIELV